MAGNETWHVRSLLIKHEDKFKMNKNLLAVAVAGLSLVAGVAQAADANFQNDVVLSVFDNTNGKAYSLDTGVTFQSLDPNYLATAGTDTDAQQKAFKPSLSGLNLIFSYATDSNFAALVNAEAAGDHIYWTINGTDSNDLVSTFTTPTTAATISTDLALQGTASGFNNSASAIYAELGDQATTQTSTANSIFVGSLSNYANAAHYGVNVGSQEGGLVNAALAGANLNLWAIYANQSSGDNLTNNYGALNFTLTGAGSSTVGTLSVVPATVATVPLPTTTWMFLSGVMGLLSIKRRKDSAV
jgi:hypothetical protein